MPFPGTEAPADVYELTRDILYTRDSKWGYTDLVIHKSEGHLFMPSCSAASKVQEGMSAATSQKLIHPPATWSSTGRTWAACLALGSSASRTNQCQASVLRTGVVVRPSDARVRFKLSNLQGLIPPIEGTGLPQMCLTKEMD